MKNYRITKSVLLRATRLPGKTMKRYLVDEIFVPFDGHKKDQKKHEFCVADIVILGICRTIVYGADPARMKDAMAEIRQHVVQHEKHLQNLKWLVVDMYEYKFKFIVNPEKPDGLPGKESKLFQVISIEDFIRRYKQFNTMRMRMRLKG